MNDSEWTWYDPLYRILTFYILVLRDQVSWGTKDLLAAFIPCFLSLFCVIHWFESCHHHYEICLACPCLVLILSQKTADETAYFGSGNYDCAEVKAHSWPRLQQVQFFNGSVNFCSCSNSFANSNVEHFCTCPCISLIFEIGFWINIFCNMILMIDCYTIFSRSALYLWTHF